MKKIICLVLVAIMILSISAVAFAASPEGGTVTIGKRLVKLGECSAEGKAALEAAMPDMLKDKLTEGQTSEAAAFFSCASSGRAEAPVAGIKAGDIVFVLFRDAKGDIRLIKATARDGKVLFNVPGAGEFAIVKLAGGEKTVPSTGDSNRLMKLVLVGVAAVSIMALAGVAIKRTDV